MYIEFTFKTKKRKGVKTNQKTILKKEKKDNQ